MMPGLGTKILEFTLILWELIIHGIKFSYGHTINQKYLSHTIYFLDQIIGTCWLLFSQQYPLKFFSFHFLHCTLLNSYMSK